ncbi:hypothetical protein [Mucilaginibacter humi]|uniref:hypothetical protein n=1 Tax=Mucilaginibacter humi TaxID=2732510 RepID=UPI001FE97F7C|nr:hypothetical protein [Mucilaginibacter humi]
MKLKLLFLTPLLSVNFAFAQQPDLVHYVNTLQGTNSKHQLTRGNTYPTTALPFGMHTGHRKPAKTAMAGNTNIF